MTATATGIRPEIAGAGVRQRHGSARPSLLTGGHRGPRLEGGRIDREPGRDAPFERRDGDLERAAARLAGRGGGLGGLLGVHTLAAGGGVGEQSIDRRAEAGDRPGRRVGLAAGRN